MRHAAVGDVVEIRGCAPDTGVNRAAGVEQHARVAVFGAERAVFRQQPAEIRESQQHDAAELPDRAQMIGERPDAAAEFVIEPAMLRQLIDMRIERCRALVEGADRNEVGVRRATRLDHVRGPAQRAAEGAVSG